LYAVPTACAASSITGIPARSAAARIGSRSAARRRNGRDHRLRAGGDPCRERVGPHLERPVVDVGEDGRRPSQDDLVDGGGERHRRGGHLVPRADPQGREDDVEPGGGGGDGDGVRRPRDLAEDGLQLRDLRPARDPAGAQRLRDRRTSSSPRRDGTTAGNRRGSSRARPLLAARWGGSGSESVHDEDTLIGPVEQPVPGNFSRTREACRCGHAEDAGRRIPQGEERRVVEEERVPVRRPVRPELELSHSFTRTQRRFV